MLRVTRGTLASALLGVTALIGCVPTVDPLPDTSAEAVDANPAGPGDGAALDVEDAAPRDDTPPTGDSVLMGQDVAPRGDTPPAVDAEVDAMDIDGQSTKDTSPDTTTDPCGEAPPPCPWQFGV
ncbi:MAG: hypothetical protein QF464_10430, partial [Myxococcota bacterium]|nr:hypothetical protein [Myxococcota bacterium]